MEEKSGSFHDIVFVTKGSALKTPCPKKIPKVMEEEDQKGGKKEGEEVRVKSKKRKIAIGLIISLSALMFGYSIKEIPTITIAQLAQHYNITMDQDVALSILIGILPFGAVFGAIITKIMMKSFKRLSGIYIFTIVNIVAVGIININVFAALLVGRFLEGICIGFYGAIAPIYLREIAPKELRKLLGLFFSLGKVIGVLIVIILELILSAAEVTYKYRIILSLTAFFSVIQAILIFFFGSNTPTEFIERGQHEEARDVIKTLYKEKYVEEVMKEYIEESEAATEHHRSEDEDSHKKKKKLHKKAMELERRLDKKQGKSVLDGKEQKISHKKMKLPAQSDAQSSMHESEFEVKESSINPSIKDGQTIVANSSMASEPRPKLKFAEKRNKAECLGLHLAGIRNLTGANTVITQGGIFIKHLNHGLGTYTSLIINSIQLLSVFIGLFFIAPIMGKKPLFLVTLPSMCLLNFAIVLAMIYEQVLALILILCIFMAIYGAGLLSPIWSYPSEIIPASKALPSNIFYWISLAICLLVPPLVSGANNANPFPVFIFFGIYSLISFAHVRLTMRESNGLSYKQIIQSFK